MTPGKSRQITVGRQGSPRNPWICKQESLTCRRCGATPGEQCVTSTGTFAMRPHMERFWDAGGTPERDGQRTSLLKASREARQRVFAHYGSSCACCGTTEELSIDHVGGGGDRHRKEIGGGSHKLYKWLIRNGFPPGFQTLCIPCNASKFDGEHCRIHDRICPTCHRPLDEGVVLAGRGSRARSGLIAVPARRTEAS